MLLVCSGELLLACCTYDVITVLHLWRADDHLDSDLTLLEYSVFDTFPSMEELTPPQTNEPGVFDRSKVLKQLWEGMLCQVLC